mmetsp:Transcript_106730/g.168635  ORF Transcript_106730/g.168635 Transcript_106730/m.168635 type:complete len:236 (+) Transcript_106730:982-1689(+)
MQTIQRITNRLCIQSVPTHVDLRQKRCQNTFHLGAVFRCPQTIQGISDLLGIQRFAALLHFAPEHHQHASHVRRLPEGLQAINRVSNSLGIKGFWAFMCFHDQFRQDALYFRRVPQPPQTKQCICNMLGPKVFLTCLYLQRHSCAEAPHSRRGTALRLEAIHGIADLLSLEWTTDPFKLKCEGLKKLLHFGSISNRLNTVDGIANSLSIQLVVALRSFSFQCRMKTAINLRTFQE